MKVKEDAGALAPQGFKLKQRRRGFSLVYFHISREFVLNFLVSFAFFFIIFFINQILLLVKRVMLKSVDIQTMLILVVCAIPQFLLYVLPFSTLSASSMVLGDLSANNELLALRSVGVPMRRVYRMLLVNALLLTCLTFYISDYLVPWSAEVYKNMLSDVMRELPTFEIRSDGVNAIGDIVMKNGKVEGDTIGDIIILNESGGMQQSVTSPSGKLELIDPVRFVYSLELEEPEFIFTEANIHNWSLSESAKATLYLDFSSQVPALTSQAPSQLSSKDLLALIAERRELKESDTAFYHQSREAELVRAAGLLDGVDAIAEAEEIRSELEGHMISYKEIGDEEPINFYYQYYSAELHKKFVLSFACFALTVVCLPLSYIKIKYGRLMGFGISLLLAVLFWYFLFAVQLRIFDVTFEAGILMWLPDIFMLLLGITLLFIKRRH